MIHPRPGKMHVQHLCPHALLGQEPDSDDDSIPTVSHVTDDILISRRGKLWLEHSKMTHNHLFHSLMMDIQSVIHSICIIDDDQQYCVDRIIHC
jgi:hypothetical protein